MAQKLNLVIDQGSTFITTFTMNDDDGNPINLSTYTGSSQIRKHYTSSNATSFTVGLANTGVVTLSLLANTTNLMTPGRYVYDVELVDGDGDVSRVVEGLVTITPGVTR